MSVHADPEVPQAAPANASFRTHNLAQAKRVSDRTMFLHSGRLVEHNDTGRIFSAPASELTAHYIEGRFG